MAPTITPSIAPSITPSVAPSTASSAAPSVAPSVATSTITIPTLSTEPSEAPYLSSPSSTLAPSTLINSSGSAVKLNSISQPAVIGLIVAVGTFLCLAAFVGIRLMSYRSLNQKGNKQFFRKWVNWNEETSRNVVMNNWMKKKPGKSHMGRKLVLDSDDFEYEINGSSMAHNSVGNNPFADSTQLRNSFASSNVARTSLGEKIFTNSSEVRNTIASTSSNRRSLLIDQIKHSRTASGVINLGVSEPVNLNDCKGPSSVSQPNIEIASTHTSIRKGSDIYDEDMYDYFAYIQSLFSLYVSPPWSSTSSLSSSSSTPSIAAIPSTHLRSEQHTPQLLATTSSRSIG